MALQLIRSSERTESGLQLVELQQVAAQVLCPTALTRARYEAAAREGLGPRRSAQVNDRSQVVLLPERCRWNFVFGERARDGPVQKGRGHLDGVAGNDACVRPVEPARSEVIPRAVLNYGVVANAITLCVPERRIGDLKHADGAGSRPIPLEGIRAPAPGPARPRHRVARTFDLRERREQFGRDDRGRMLAEERAIRPPGSGWALDERLADGEKHLGRFAPHLDHPIRSRPQSGDGGEGCDNAHPYRRPPEKVTPVRDLAGDSRGERPDRAQLLSRRSDPGDARSGHARRYRKR